MQAIQTTYRGPGKKGPRIQAKCAARTRYYAHDHGLNLDDNHRYAASMLADELEWHYGEWYMGSMVDGSYVHVLADSITLSFFQS